MERKSRDLNFFLPLFVFLEDVSMSVTLNSSILPLGIYPEFFSWFSLIPEEGNTQTLCSVPKL